MPCCMKNIKIKLNLKDNSGNLLNCNNYTPYLTTFKCSNIVSQGTTHHYNIDLKCDKIVLAYCYSYWQFVYLSEKCTPKYLSVLSFS
jgi:hypothetical protein